MNLNNSLRKTPVAVIGMSSLFADAKNIEEFWNNIVQAKDSITDVPEDRWRIEDYYDPDPTVPDKTYCKRGGFCLILILTLWNLVCHQIFWK